ncbi:MAG: hypothetical protein ACLFVY_02785 [Phycisphaerae bacterium]
MLYQLWNYFGVSGTVSILLWLAAIVVAVVALWSRRRTVMLLAAVVIAAGAFTLAKVNSSKISKYRTDRSDVIAAAHKSMEESRAKDVRKQTADVQVASDSADANDPNTPRSEYAYREVRGKQTRRTDGNDDPNQKMHDELAFLADREAEKADPDIRLLPAEDVSRANQWDRVNLFLTRWVLLLGAILLGVDYLGRFVPALRKVLPEKPRPAPAVRTASGEEMREYLEEAIQNGETFIYCTHQDPWPEGELSRLPADFGWSMEKITYNADNPPFSSEFIFESAWFRDYCFVIEGEETAAGLLSDLTNWLEMRFHARAQTPCPVHIVWEFDRPSDEQLEELAFYAREAHIRLLVKE